MSYPTLLSLRILKNYTRTILFKKQFSADYIPEQMHVIFSRFCHFRRLGRRLWEFLPFELRLQHRHKKFVT
jgi:hypothetical protein